MKKNSDARIRSIAEYDKKTKHGVYLKLNINTDKDIIEHLDSLPNKQGYIKELIRADISQ